MDKDNFEQTSLDEANGEFFHGKYALTKEQYFAAMGQRDKERAEKRKAYYEKLGVPDPELVKVEATKTTEENASIETPDTIKKHGNPKLDKNTFRPIQKNE